MKRLLLFCFFVLGFFTFQEDKYLIDIGQVDVSQLPVVTLYINVTDDKGNPITNLQEEDFSITEDGKYLKITEFAGMGENRPVDIVFVFDVSGSMQDKINSTTRICIDFAEDLENANRDYRLGLIAYGDVIEKVYYSDYTLTDDVNTFKNWLNNLRADNSGSFEQSLYALQIADRMKFRDEAQVIFILITDEPLYEYQTTSIDGDFPPWSNSDWTITHTVELLKKPQQISVFPIALAQDPGFKQLAQDTNGRFYDIYATQNFSDIISNVGMVIATQYKISYTTPRPDFDGTRRNITVEIGESNTSAGYLEPHLINLKSNIVVGLGCLAPLMLALIIPFAIILFMHKKTSTLPDFQESAPPSQPASINAQQLPTSDIRFSDKVCISCGSLLKPGAKFCNHCGNPAYPDEVHRCSRCGKSQKPHAKFCPVCGNKLN